MQTEVIEETHKYEFSHLGVPREYQKFDFVDLPQVDYNLPKEELSK